MKDYSLSLNNWYQLAEKYIYDLDKDITSVINFLDFVNPNYIILNTEYVPFGDNFIPDNKLNVPLGILTLDGTNITRINLDKMWIHSIIINNFGQGTKNIYWNNNIIDNLLEGFALIARGLSLDNKPLYSIVSLDSSGTYYALKNVVSNSNVLTYNWGYFPNATDTFGVRYLFTLTPPGTRYLYRDNTDSSWKSLEDLTDPFIITTYAYDQTTDYITTIIGSYWNTAYNLGYELVVSKEQDDAFIVEEVYCDEKATSSTVIVNSQPVARHRVSTNLESCYGLNFYINYY